MQTQDRKNTSNAKTRRLGDVTAHTRTKGLPALACALELPLPFTATDAVATPACLGLPTMHKVYKIKHCMLPTMYMLC